MSVGKTDKHNIALYDTVTGWAFGPVFRDRAEADRFLVFAAGWDGWPGHDKDVRVLTSSQLETLHMAWLQSEGRLAAH